MCFRLDNALQEFMKDFADRMKEINTSLSSNSSADAADSSTLAEKEALCDELIEIVENVDYARGELCACGLKGQSMWAVLSCVLGGCIATHCASMQDVSEAGVSR